jgi:subtilisin family serine protease
LGTPPRLAQIITGGAMKRELKFLVAACVSAFAAGAAQADTSYVLTAGKWGKAQQRAVAAAGGTVKFASDEAGIAVVTSANPNFLAELRGSGDISSGAADMVVDWTPPVQRVDLAPSAVDPSDDRFFSFIQWAPQAVKAPDAWAMGFTGAGVRVAVIDGGIYGAHPDLAANVDGAAGRSFVIGPPASCEVQWDCDTGTFWHGTHVAGIIAAADNAIGVVGIAPEATIVPVKALHAGSGSFEAVIQAILYASDQAPSGGRADIINMSLGAVFPRSEPGAAELISALNKAVNTATRRGVLVLSAAGNDALDMDHTGDLISTPAENGNGLAVSATGPFGFAYGATDFTRFASYSNYGTSMVSVAGPGGDFAWPTNELCSLSATNPSALVTIPCWAFDMVLSTSRAGYTWAAGTSMATPAAAAVAALIKQKHPNISVGQWKNRLMQTANDEGKPGVDPFYGRGFVNAHRAVMN